MRVVIAFASIFASFAMVAACVGDDPTGATPQPDAAVAPETGGLDAPANDSTSPVDAATACRVDDAFDAPQELAGLAAYSPVHVRLTADELEIYFQNSNEQRLMVAQRATASGTFDTPKYLDTTIPDAGTQAFDPTISGDGLVLIFDLDGKLARMTRNDRQSPFGTAQLIGLDDPQSLEEDPHLLGDKHALYFVRRLLSNNTLSLWRASSGPSGFDTPGAVPVTGSLPNNPFVTDDELVIYYSAGSRIQRATRSSPAVTFETGTNVSELDVADLDAGAADRPGWLSPDGCRMYFVSGPAVGAKAYIATRKPR